MAICYLVFDAERVLAVASAVLLLFLAHTIFLLLARHELSVKVTIALALLRALAQRAALQSPVT